jgi:hypothetical protein
VARREKSRVSLILEETFENEETKNEINSILLQMNEQARLNATAPVNSVPTSEEQDHNRSISLPTQFAPTVIPASSTPTVPSIPIVLPSPISAVLPCPEAASEPGPSTAEMVGPSQSSMIDGNADLTPVQDIDPIFPSSTHTTPREVPGVALFPDAVQLIPTLSPDLPSSLPPANNAINVAIVQTMNNNDTSFKVPDSPDPLNPWDFVPDQPKFKQHGRTSSSAVNGNADSHTCFNNNPADEWLASLTDKISDVQLANTNLADTTNNGESEDPLDTEWVAIANRNNMTITDVVKNNTNPFKTYI